MLLGRVVKLLLTEHGEGLHFLHDLAHVLHGVDHVAGAGLALGADHGRAFGNAPQRLAQVARAADKRRGEGMLVDVVSLVGRGQHFGLVDEVDANLLQNLGLGKVADAGLGHHGDGNRLHNLLDEARPGHAGHAALGANHGRHPLQSHDRSCAGFLGNAGLFHVHHVHDDAAFQHLGQTDFEAQAGAGNGLVSIGF